MYSYAVPSTKETIIVYLVSKTTMVNNFFATWPGSTGKKDYSLVNSSARGRTSSESLRSAPRLRWIEWLAPIIGHAKNVPIPQLADGNVAIYATISVVGIPLDYDHIAALMPFSLASCKSG
jgi:hypothetical protein